MSDKGSLSEKKSFDWTFVKGFAAGLVVSHINKTLMLGVLLGTVSGIYVEQNYDSIPHVRTELRKILTMLQDAAGKSRK